jgi:hypothetical protein
MKPAIFISLAILLITSACVRPISTAPATSGRNPFTPEAEALLCVATDLETSSSQHVDGGGGILGVTLINRSENSCKLQNPPQVALLGANGPLEVESSASANESETEELTIASGESAVLVLVWDNYCGAALTNGPIISLTLPGGEKLDVRADAASVPGCQDAAAPSTLTIHPYSYPP